MKHLKRNNLKFQIGTISVIAAVKKEFFSKRKMGEKTERKKRGIYSSGLSAPNSSQPNPYLIHNHHLSPSTVHRKRNRRKPTLLGKGPLPIHQIHEEVVPAAGPVEVRQVVQNVGQGSRGGRGCHMAGACQQTALGSTKALNVQPFSPSPTLSLVH